MFDFEVLKFENLLIELKFDLFENLWIESIENLFCRKYLNLNWKCKFEIYLLLILNLKTKFENLKFEFWNLMIELKWLIVKFWNLNIWNLFEILNWIFEILWWKLLKNDDELKWLKFKWIWIWNLKFESEIWICSYLFEFIWIWIWSWNLKFDIWCRCLKCIWNLFEILNDERVTNFAKWIGIWNWKFADLKILLVKFEKLFTDLNLKFDIWNLKLNAEFEFYIFWNEDVMQNFEIWFIIYLKLVIILFEIYLKFDLKLNDVVAENFEIWCNLMFVMKIWNEFENFIEIWKFENLNEIWNEMKIWNLIENLNLFETNWMNLIWNLKFCWNLMKFVWMKIWWYIENLKICWRWNLTKFWKLIYFIWKYFDEIKCWKIWNERKNEFEIWILKAEKFWKFDVILF